MPALRRTVSSSSSIFIRRSPTWPGCRFRMDLEGTSFKPLLENPHLPWMAAAFSQYPRNVGDQSLMGYSMRTTRHRFTVWVDRNDPAKVEAIELYDRSFDKQENNNIANDPAQAATVDRLMVQWRKGWRGALPRASSD